MQWSSLHAVGNHKNLLFQLLRCWASQQTRANHWHGSNHHSFYNTVLDLSTSFVEFVNLLLLLEKLII